MGKSILIVYLFIKINIDELFYHSGYWEPSFPGAKVLKQSPYITSSQEIGKRFFFVLVLVNKFALKKS